MGSDPNHRTLPSFAEQIRELSDVLCEDARKDPNRALRFLLFQYSHYCANWIIKPLDVCLEELYMRGKSKPAGKSVEKQAWQTTFVDVKVSSATRDEIIDLYGSTDAFSDAIATLIESGYRVGVSYNHSNGSVIATLTCKDESSVNAGCTLSAFAGDWVTALCVLFYKHFDVSKQNWRGAASQTPPAAFG